VAVGGGVRLVCCERGRAGPSWRLRGPGAGVPVHSTHRRIVFKCRRIARRVRGRASSIAPCITAVVTLFWHRRFSAEGLMTHRYIKLGLTAVVLIAAFAGLLWSTLRDGTEYFKHVDEVMTNPQAWEGKPLQLHGYVVPG